MDAEELALYFKKAMALKAVELFLLPKQPNQFPILSHHLIRNKLITQHDKFSRRTSTILIATTSILLAGATTSCSQAFDFRMTVPDQTVEEAMAALKFHVPSFLQVKEMFESTEPNLWKEVQRELRKRSSYLKQDMYTIIQGKPGEERPQMRKLYTTMFNKVTRLDYAARDKDEDSVKMYWDNIVVDLNDFLSRI